MNVKPITANVRNKSILRVVIITILILLIPFIAMQFSNEVSWELEDFVSMGILLIGTGLMYEFAIKKRKSVAQRAVFTALLIGILLFIWVELAVGIFDMPFSGH